MVFAYLLNKIPLIGLSQWTHIFFKLRDIIKINLYDF